MEPDAAVNTLNNLTPGTVAWVVGICLTSVIGTFGGVITYLHKQNTNQTADFAKLIDKLTLEFKAVREDFKKEADSDRKIRHKQANQFTVLFGKLYTFLSDHDFTPKTRRNQETK